MFDVDFRQTSQHARTAPTACQRQGLHRIALRQGAVAYGGMDITQQHAHRIGAIPSGQ